MIRDEIVHAFGRFLPAWTRIKSFRTSDVGYTDGHAEWVKFSKFSSPAKLKMDDGGPLDIYFYGGK